MTGSRSRDTFLAAVFAMAGLAILVDQAAIILTQILPATPGIIGWRYGTVGLTVGRGTPVLLADLLLLLAATLWARRLVVRLAAVVHLLMAPVLLALLATFTLDAVQIIGGVPESGLVETRLGAGRAAGMLLILAGYAAWSGWLLWRHSGTIRTEQRAGVERGVLVVGSERPDPVGGTRGS